MARSSVHPPRLAAVGVLVFGLTVQACGSDATGVDGNPPGPAFVLTVGTSNIAVTPGATASTFIKVTRSGGLTSGIIYSVSGAPNGLAVTVVGSSVADSFTVVVDAAATLAAGAYPIVVDAAAAGASPQREALSVAVSAPADRPPLDLVVAGEHTCALTTTGAAYCWGFNGHGELGNGAVGIVNATPVAVAGGLTFQTLSVSKVTGVTCGLTASGAAYCWGQNDGGQLGDGTKVDRLIPTPVAGGLAFTSIAVGNAHACGVEMRGTAYCWGTSPNGAFGDGSAGTHLTPTATAPGLLLESIVAGSDYTCGVTLTGAAYCWGVGVQGQLGNGAPVVTTIPVAVAGGLTFLGLAAGGQSVCGLTNEGKAYCWGYNFYGTLGDGTLLRRLVPVPVSGGLTFQSISAGYETMCGVTRAGVGYCWGYNFGALGDGTSDHRSAPTAVAGGLVFRRISAGTGYGCGVTTASAVYCWGENSDGELGDGTIISRETPAVVRWP